MKFSILTLLTLFATILVTQPSKAYYATLDTGDLVAVERYRASVAPQLIVNKYDGMNLTGRFDTGINPDSSIRAILGFGKVDFQAGVLYKYIPFPDLETQPALGGMAGVLFSRVEGSTELSLRFHPLVSKKMHSDIGAFNWYGSLPLGLTSRSNETFVPIQLAGGTEYAAPNWKVFKVMGEVGINLNKSFSYITVAAVFDFDENTLQRR